MRNPLTPTLRRRGRLAAMCVIAAGLTASMAAGCSSGEGEASGTTTAVASTPVATEAPTTTGAPTTTAAVAPVTTAPKAGMTADEIAVRNVLDQYYAEVALGSNPPDPDRASLVNLLSGPFRGSVQELLRGARAKDQRAERRGGGPIRHRTESLDMRDINTAFAVECVIDDMVLYDSAGAVVDDEVTSYFTNTTVTRSSDGQWHVDQSQKQPGGGTCVGL